MKPVPSLTLESLEKCMICPRRCGVNRLMGETGYCGAGSKVRIYSHYPHHGEEPVLSGKSGSGTIFFSHCNMKCAYCQNYYFSQLGAGREVSVEGLSGIMLELGEAGCHNINLVNPTHYVPQIAAAIEAARKEGLTLPIVYNSGGYDLVDTIKLLNGIINIYMPDMRYSSDDTARRYSDAVNYVEHNRAAVMEMQAQAGDLVIDRDGIAKSGLMIRLLVLPEGISGTKETLMFIAAHVSRGAYLSIMSQYYPTFRANDFKEISRGIRNEEYEEVLEEARRLDLKNGWIQALPSGVDLEFAGTNMEEKSPKKNG